MVPQKFRACMPFLLWYQGFSLHSGSYDFAFVCSLWNTRMYISIDECVSWSQVTILSWKSGEWFSVLPSRIHKCFFFSLRSRLNFFYENMWNLACRKLSFELFMNPHIYCRSLSFDHHVSYWLEFSLFQLIFVTHCIISPQILRCNATLILFTTYCVFSFVDISVFVD